MAMSFCLFVRLSPVKFVKSFATWQHLAASGAFRIVSDTLVECFTDIVRDLWIVTWTFHYSASL